MNNITLPVRELKTALTGLGKIISKRASLPVLQHVRAERAADGVTTISATDLDAFASYRFAQGSEGKAESILVPFTALNSIVKSCGADEAITIEKSSGDHTLIHYQIGGQAAEQRVASLPSDEWPPLPKINGERVLLDGALRSALLEAFKCVSSDETRYVLRGAYIDVSDKRSHYIVGTDGRHLFASNSFHVPIGTSVIIPEHRFLDWKGFGQDGDWLLRIESDNNGQPAYIELTSFGWTFTAKAIDGNYPNWRQVLPDPSGRKTTIKVPTNALAEFAEIIGKLPCDQINHPVGLKLDRQGKLILFGRAAEIDKLTEVAFSSAEVTGQAVTVCLNRNYLAKALRFGLNEIQIQDALSPVRCTDQSGRQVIIMPLRMDGVTPQPAPTQPSSPSQKTAQASPTSGSNNMQNENKNGQPATSPRDPAKTAIKTKKGIKMIAAEQQPRRANLVLHCGANAVARTRVVGVSTPKPTSTWSPIPHSVLVEQVQVALHANALHVVGQAHSLTHDGSRYFGLLEIRNGAVHPDYTWVLGLRNSHDKSFPAGLVAGGSVFVCDNLSFSGEIKITRKHTRFILLDLPRLIAGAVERLIGEFRHQDQRIAAYKGKTVTDRSAHDLIIRSTDVGACTNRQIPAVLKMWREPKHDEFASRNAWSLFNSFTEVLKGNLTELPNRTEALHGLLDSFVGMN